MSATAKSGEQSGAEGGAWTGVTERVFATLESDGSVSGTPSQHSLVSASGTGPETIQVPVSGKISSRPSKGRNTAVVNGMAQVELDPQGTANKEVKSDYTRPLPIAVKVAYTLNGQPASAKDIKNKDGTVTVTYTLTNTTSAPVTACFQGFNGVQQHITQSTPLPIIADLSLTLPSDITNFTASGSALSTDRSGISVGWTAPLFEPLGPLSKSVTLTMTTSKASLPKASLLVVTVNPFSLTGRAAAASAVAVGDAQAAMSKGLAALQNTLNELRARTTALQNGSTPTTPAAAPGRVQKQTRQHQTQQRQQRASSSELRSFVRSVAVLTAKVHALDRSVVRLKSDRTTTWSSVLETVALAHLVESHTTRVADGIAHLASSLAMAVRDVARAVDQLSGLASDLQALPSPVRSLPEVQKLADDLATAQATTDRVQREVGNASTTAKDLADQSASLATETLSLRSKGDKLKTTAARLRRAVDAVASGHLVSDVASSKVQSSLAHVQADVQHELSTLSAAVTRARITALQDAAQELAGLDSRAQAEAGQLSGRAASGLAKANQAYAQLLCLDQQAALYELPGGTAPGVTTQNGIVRYDIKN